MLDHIDASAAYAAPKRDAKAVCADAAVITAVLTTANAALGAGILAYPVAFHYAGLVGGSMLLTALATLAAIALGIIFIVASTPHQPLVDYSQLVRTILGPRAHAVVTGLILLYMFGTCCSYLHLLSDMIAPILSPHKKHASVFSVLGDCHKSGDVQASDLERILIMCGGAFLCALLCLLRTVSALRYSALLAVLVTLFTVGMLVDTAAIVHKPPPGITLWPASVMSLFRAVPVVAFALQCHIQSVAVYYEMPKRVRNRPTTWIVAVSAIGLISVLYLPTGIAGLLAYGSGTCSDIMDDFDRSPLHNVARACVAVTTVCVFPMNYFPARSILYIWYRECAGYCQRRRAPAGTSTSQGAVALINSEDVAIGAVHSPSFTFIATLSFVWVGCILGLSIALLHQPIDKFFGLIGALCGGNVIFTLPGLMWLRVGTWAKYSLGIMLTAVGIFITVVGTYCTLFH